MTGVYYKLSEDSTPVSCDIIEWSRWMADVNRTIALDEFGEWGRISTVFLGIDLSFGFGGVPVLWETIIFGGPFDSRMWRHTSKGIALDKHMRIASAFRRLIKMKATRQCRKLADREIQRQKTLSISGKYGRNIERSGGLR
jgi:hypothetical protein